MVTIEVTGIEARRLKPGDILVYRTDKLLTPETRSRVSSKLSELVKVAGFNDEEVTVVVVDNGADLEVLRRDVSSIDELEIIERIKAELKEELSI